MRKTFAACGLLLLLAWPALSSGLKSDERALFFPTHAARTADGSWEAPLHALVFEPETHSPMRAAFIKALRELIGNHWTEEEEKTFHQRAMLFLIDRERGKTLELPIIDAKAAIGPSRQDGHARGKAVFRAEGRWVTFGDPSDKGLGGEVELVEPVGVSVISDIDDTIKITQVPDRAELIKNTFLRPFRQVPGMAEVYARWAAQGVSFTYVSGTPWELYPAFRDFLARDGFPKGAVHLRQIDYDPGGIKRLADPPTGLKADALKEIFTRFPSRKFFLVGDSGERDPEIYGQAARDYPAQVAGIFIRDIQIKDDDGTRYPKAFAGVAEGKWKIFRSPEELPERLVEGK